jgi:hypothetical protein
MTANWYIIPAALMAALVPLALIATRQELRKVRLRLVEELRTTLFKHQPDLPQLELIAARYRASEESSGPAGSDQDPAGKPRQGLVMIWTGAAFFFLVCFIGFLILFVPRVWLLSESPGQFPRITYSLLWLIRDDPIELARAVTVAGIAFLGGYVFQLRYLVRATLNQELGALSFVRATLQIVQGVIVALVAYRVLDSTGVGDSDAAFAGALATAFVFGLFPSFGLMKIAKAARVRAKTIDEKAMEAAKTVPLEVIDGIDAETAFRLEESNLYDVQNLAAINPIGLYAESPFSLYEILDWVLQAQLCVNVGAPAFAALKNHRIRTIFDLERAVLAEGAPEPYLRAVGSVLFQGADPAFRRALGLPASATDAPVDGIDIDPQTVRHAVAIMCDDLHIHRLRALWRTMLHTTGGDARGNWLFETGPLPGDSKRSTRTGPEAPRPGGPQPAEGDEAGTPAEGGSLPGPPAA